MNEKIVRAVDGQLWQELLAALDAAVCDGSRRPLGRLAEREGLPVHDALQELEAFPARSCAALERGAALRPVACTANRGCPVARECPLVRGGAAGIAASAVASFVGTCAERWTKALPPAPFRDLEELLPAVERLLERSGRTGPDTPPRARTARSVVAVAIRRGGPVGATGPFLSLAELEQVAAFTPPGSGRGDPALGPVETFLRRAVCAEVALVDPARGVE